MTLNDDSAAYYPARKSTLSHRFFLLTHRYTTDPQAPSPGKMSTPVKPYFTILKWVVRGSKSHGRAIMMQSYTKFFAFFGVVFVFVCVCACAPEARTCNLNQLIGLRARH